jgi:chromosome partitioning protein
MYTLVVASQKGGVGKTTIAGHLGVAAEATCGPVFWIDTDPQASLTTWWNAREAKTPALTEVPLKQLGERLKSLADAGCKLTIIDTPPAVTDTIRSVIATADLVLIPTRPSPHDLRAVGSTVALAEAAGKRMVFVVNGATPRARITGEAAIALSQHGTVAPVTLYNRVDYAASMIDGRTVQEMDPTSRSAEEVTSLWAYVHTQLKKKDTSRRKA